MTHANAPLTPEGRKRLVERCRTRPIAHVATEMGISRAAASKWVNRYYRYGELWLLDRSSARVMQPTATPPELIEQIGSMRREQKWSASRIAFELEQAGTPVSRRTITRLLAQLGLNRRRSIDPSGENNREVKKIVAKHPGHMVHLDVKNAGRIPAGGGLRAHGRDSAKARAVARARERRTCTGYLYLHSAIDGHTRLAYTEALENEQVATAIAFLGRAREWFAKHGITKIERIITDNGACYRAQGLAAALDGSHHRRTKPYTPKHNGKVERYNRILAEEFLYARPYLALRSRTISRARSLEPALQLPPAPRRTRRTTASSCDAITRKQRPGLLQLIGSAYHKSERSQTMHAMSGHVSRAGRNDDVLRYRQRASAPSAADPEW